MAHRVTAAELVRLGLDTIAALSGEPLVRAAVAPGRAHILALGKAAAAMARGALSVVEPLGGAVVDGVGAPLPGLRCLAGAHPVPDERSAAGGLALLDAARAVVPGERVVALLSGGASAMAALPQPGVSVAELAETTRRLLASGRPIAAINAERRRLTQLGAGGLLAALPAGAHVEALALSDIVGASGDALWESLGSGPLAGEAAHLVVERRVLADPQTLALTAWDRFTAAGLDVSPLPLFDGDAAEVVDWLVQAHASLAPGEVAIGAGEPTLALPPQAGSGGRAQHVAATTVLKLRGGFVVVALGSDGRDGNSPAMGAALDDSMPLGGLASALAAFDSHRALAEIGAAVPSRATGTNLTDLYVVARR
jgi:hydroxypyruvate reductase